VRIIHIIYYILYIYYTFQLFNHLTFQLGKCSHHHHHQYSFIKSPCCGIFDLGNASNLSFRCRQRQMLASDIENARSSKNWIGPIQYFPAEVDRRFRTGPVLTVQRVRSPVSVRLHVGLSILLLRRRRLCERVTARHWLSSSDRPATDLTIYIKFVQGVQ